MTVGVEQIGDTSAAMGTADAVIGQIGDINGVESVPVGLGVGGERIPEQPCLGGTLDLADLFPRIQSERRGVIFAVNSSETLIDDIIGQSIGVIVYIGSDGSNVFYGVGIFG